MKPYSPKAEEVLKRSFTEYFWTISPSFIFTPVIKSWTASNFRRLPRLASSCRTSAKIKNTHAALLACSLLGLRKNVLVSNT
jgi:hypothetical protein